MKIALALIGGLAALFGVVLFLAEESVAKAMAGLAVAAFVVVACCVAGLLNGQAEK
jgi:hypothetical protein